MQLKIKFCNLFIFILPFYGVKMVYLFARVTQVVPIYKFSGIFFLFNWTWICYRLSYIVKNNSFRKKKKKKKKPLYIKLKQVGKVL